VVSTQSTTRYRSKVFFFFFFFAEQVNFWVELEESFFIKREIGNLNRIIKNK
jgi:hypothetical protein